MARHQVVFLATTDANGNAEVLSPPPLSGQIVSIDYITDNRIPYEPGATFAFSGEKTAVDVHEVASVDGRERWEPNNHAPLANERLKVTVTNGGKGRSGSFLIVFDDLKK